MTTAKMIETQDLLLKEPQVSTRGAKSCTLTKTNGERLTFQLGSKASPTTTPFGATLFNDDGRSSRKTIEFHITAEQEAEIEAFDEWAIQYLSDNSMTIFRKELTPAQVSEIYRSPVTRKATYNSHVRCKINIAGSQQVRCWDENNKRRDCPKDLRPHKLIPRITISHLWMMSREVGWVLQVNDLMVIEGADECPFF